MAAPTLEEWRARSESQKDDYVQRLRTDFRFFCAEMLQLVPKSPDAIGKRNEQVETDALVPFLFNEVQDAIWAKMVERWNKGLVMEIRILKARQFGVSTFYCAHIFWQMWRQQNYKAAVVAFRKDTTLAELNETMATFYDSMPEYARPRLRGGGKRRVSKEELYFDDRRSGCMFVPQSPHAMRGVSRHGVLTTEVSHYKEAGEFYGGFLPALDRGSRRLLIMESSPADGYFRDKYEEAKEGNSRAEAMFFPWWFMRTLCAMPLIKDRGKRYDARTHDPVHFSPEERQEQRALNVLAKERGRPEITDEQMYWRQNVIHDEYDDDEEYFNQEYPRDDTSAFERATRSAFKVSLPIMRDTAHNREILDNARVGNIYATNIEDFRTVNVVFKENHKRTWRDFQHLSRHVEESGLVIFRDVVAGYTYTQGADIASEVGEDETANERAYSTSCVYCCETHEQVAEWHGHCEPHDFGDVVAGIGYYYNTAFTAIERNNMGVTTEDRLKRYLNYPMRYRWPDFNVGPDKLTNKEMWETNNRTKPYMIGELKHWIRDGLFIVRSPGLEDECAAYLIVDGKYTIRERPSDRIIAASLAVLAAEQQYMSKVLATPHAEARTRISPAAAALAIGGIKPVPQQLPDEFYAAGEDGRYRVTDIWEHAKL